LYALVADYERALGPDHRDTLNTRIALAEIQGAADPSAAVTELRPLLDDFRRVLGFDDPETLEVEVELSAWLAETGNFEEALSRMDRALGDYRRVLGATHHDTLTLRFVAADTRRRAGRTAEAEKAMRQLYGEVAGLVEQGHLELEDLMSSIETRLS
jgi:hypothetical protein